MDNVTPIVGQNLKLDMMRVFDELLNIDA